MLLDLLDSHLGSRIGEQGLQSLSIANQTGRLLGVDLFQLRAKHVLQFAVQHHILDLALAMVGSGRQAAAIPFGGCAGVQPTTPSSPGAESTALVAGRRGLGS